MARNAPIDLLRGVAILLILLLHYSLSYRLSKSPLADWVGAGAVRAVVNNGNYGVTMFFVVSGYLITSNTLRRFGSLGTVDVRAFYVMRAARILPPLLLAVSIIVTLGLLGVPMFGNTDGGKNLPASFYFLAVGSVLTFTHNLLMQSVGYFNYCLNIYWSLSVEEVFYLAFPLLCVLARRRALVAAMCLCAIAIGPIYRHAHADDELFFMYGYAACFDAIAFGCLAALLASVQRPPPLVARWVGVAASLALAASYLAGIHGHEAFGFTSVAASSAVLVWCASASTGAGWADARALAPLRWAGRHSYELYLFHIIVLAAMRELVPRAQMGVDWKLPGLLLFIATSAGVAALVARYFSEPINAALRARFDTARAPTRSARPVSTA
ncbi:MAG: acyltransferase [Burkholderiaceae bacterium]